MQANIYTIYCFLLLTPKEKQLHLILCLLYVQYMIESAPRFDHSKDVYN
jgi:hypothetical protein